MKICHVNDRFPNFHIKAGGAEQACYDIVDLLNKAGHQNFVLTTKFNNPDYQEKNCQVYPITRLIEKVGYKLSFITRLFWFDPLVYFQAKKYFRQIKPNVVHVQLCQLLTLSVAAAAKSLGLPVVCHHYEFSFICPNFSLVDWQGKICRRFSGSYCQACAKDNHSKLAHSLRRKIFNWYDKKIDYHLVLANHWKNILTRYGIKEEKIEKMVLPVSNVKYDSSLPREKDSLVFAGWIKPHKGLWLAVQAIPEVVKQVPTAKFYVIEAGVNELYREQIINFIKKNHLDDNVIFLGRKSNKEVKEWFNKAEIVVIADQWEIAWPVTLAEAMFYARPCVASDIGGMKEMIISDDCGRLVRCNDPDDFAEKVIWLLQNKQEAIRIGEKARQVIQGICDPETLTEKLVSNYQRAM